MAHRFLLLALFFASLTSMAQTGVDQSLQSAVTAGNQAWIDGMRSGNAASIAAMFTNDAVNCSPDGQCVSGTGAIEQLMRSRMASMGRALSANVTSASLVRDRDLAYEWGVSEANFDGGRSIRGRYLTVWQRQPGGTWKILRNMGLPSQGREGRPAREAATSTPSEQSYTVRCESGDMGRHTCAAPAEIVRAEVLRQISGSACTQDRTWGWQGSSIWVDRGCRAEFTVYAYATTTAPANVYTTPQPSTDQPVTEYNDPGQARTVRC